MKKSWNDLAMWNENIKLWNFALVWQCLSDFQISLPCKIVPVENCLSKGIWIGKKCDYFVVQFYENLWN